MDLDFIFGKEIIQRMLPPGTGIIDAGCHEGAFTRFVLGEQTSFHNAIMIDPLPDKIKIVRSSFPDAKVFQCAIADEEKDTDFYVTVDYPKCSALYDREAFDKVPALKNRSKIPVKMRRLDNLFEEINIHEMNVPGWYLKIDTEGYELESFNSLGKFKDSPIIFAGHFEYGGTWQERGLKINDMLKILHDNGFMTLKGFQSSVGYELAEIISINEDYQFENIFFIRKQIANSFKPS